MRRPELKTILLAAVIFAVPVACSPSVERAPTPMPGEPTAAVSVGTSPSPPSTAATAAPTAAASLPEAACELSPPPASPPAEDDRLFASPDGALALGLDAGWSAVDLNAPDLEGELAAFQLDFPELEGTLRSFIEQSNDGGLWLVAFLKDRALISSGILPNFNLRRFEDPVTAVLPLELVVDQTLLSILSADPQVEELAYTVSVNQNGVSVGLICTRRDFSGVGAYTYQRQAIVLSGSGLIVFNFASADAVREQVIPVFDAVLHSLVLFEAPSAGE